LPPQSDADQDGKVTQVFRKSDQGIPESTKVFRYSGKVTKAFRVKRDLMYVLKETCNFAANLPAQAPIHDKEQQLPGVVGRAVGPEVVLVQKAKI
jgi:hypothetical protein